MGGVYERVWQGRSSSGVGWIMGMGLKGWLGESLLRLWLVTFFVGKGMSLMFRFYIFRYTTGRHTSFSLVVLKPSYFVVSCSNPNKPTPSARHR